MSAEYSVEEVRAQAKKELRSGVHSKSWDMLNAYADLLERIKADEGAVPDGYTALLSDGKRYWSDKPGEYGDWQPYFLGRPPAQAAQVDQVGELLAIIHGDGGHYQAEHGLQKAAKDAQEKVIQMMTKIATAEPVAQGEARCQYCDGTGDVHGIDGEWRGSCTECPAAMEREFKNFHRQLCERFGYTHDEKDWRRDQVSLIEFIAAQPRAVPDDKSRLDLLQNEIVDTIYMDDGRIIDVRGLDVRKAIDEFAATPSPGESA